MSRFSMVSDQQLSSWICPFYNGPKFAGKPTCRVRDCKMQHKLFNNEKEYLESPAYRHFILKDDSVVGQIRTKPNKPPSRGRSPDRKTKSNTKDSKKSSPSADKKNGNDSNSPRSAAAAQADNGDGARKTSKRPNSPVRKGNNTR